MFNTCATSINEMYFRRAAAVAAELSPSASSPTSVATASPNAPSSSSETEKISLLGNPGNAASVTPSIGRGMVARLKSLGLGASASSVPSSLVVTEKEVVVVKPIIQPQETKTQIKSDQMIPIFTHHEKPPVIKKGEAGTK